MTLERINPQTLPNFTTFSQIVVARGSRIVFVSGQVALNADGQLVGERDLAAQAAQAFRNLLAALRAVGATAADVAKMTWYVVNYSEEMSPVLLAARREAFGEHTPASTLVGVQALARPGFLIEVEAIAMLE